VNNRITVVVKRQLPEIVGGRPGSSLQIDAAGLGCRVSEEKTLTRNALNAPHPLRSEHVSAEYPMVSIKHHLE
jgi:hypothetical protein